MADNKGEDKGMDFTAQIKQVSSKSLVSLDKEAQIVLRTGDMWVMDLGKLPADTNVKVRVEIE